MGFRKPRRVILFVLATLVVTATASAQSRINTKELSQELRKLADQAREEAEQALADAEKARQAEDLTRERIAELDAEIARLERQIQEDREKKIEALEIVVQLMMDHEKIGPILRKSPHSIRVVPDIERVLRGRPWLDTALEKILEEYSPSSDSHA